MKRIIHIVLTLALCLSTASSFAAKVTDYPSGGNVQSGDITYIVRGGTSGDSLYGIIPLASSSTAGLVQCGSGTVCNNGTLSVGGLTFSNIAGVASIGQIPTLPTSSISGLAPSATTDTTNAANITSGTLSLARIASNIFSSTLAGLVPASGGGTSNFLRADGNWVPPAGSGTVTTFSCVSANGVSCSVANPTTTPTATFTLGAINPTSIGLSTSGAADFASLLAATTTLTSAIYATGLSSGTVAVNSYLGLNASNQVVLGAGGSGTVNSGTSGNFAYYASTGTAVSGVAPGNTLAIGSSGVNVTQPADRIVSIGTDALTANDCGRLVKYNTSGTVAISLAAASTSGLTQGCAFLVNNVGTANDTITPTTSTINGSSSLVIPPGTGCAIRSDSTNYQVDYSSCTALALPAGNVATTPADNTTCTAGQMWFDTGFVYICTTSGTVKRATLATF